MLVSTHSHFILFIMLYKMLLTFKCVDEIVVCDYSNESYWAVLSCGTVYFAVQGGSNFYVYTRMNPFSYCVTIQMKATEQYFSCGTIYYAVEGVPNFSRLYVDESLYLLCDHSN